MNKIPVYIKFFNKNDINDFFINIDNYEKFCKIEESVEIFKNNWSTYKLQFPVFRRIFKSEIINNNNYILCVFYKNNKNFYDIQFGTSETAKYDEDYINTFRRCIGEELGLNIPEQNINKCHFNNFKFRNKNVNLWIVNIENLKKNNETKNENIKLDNKNNKTYCIIHGNEKQILEYFKNDINLDKSDDNIKGIIAFRLNDLKYII